MRHRVARLVSGVAVGVLLLALQTGVAHASNLPYDGTDPYSTHCNRSTTVPYSFTDSYWHVELVYSYTCATAWVAANCTAPWWWGCDGLVFFKVVRTNDDREEWVEQFNSATGGYWIHSPQVYDWGYYSSSACFTNDGAPGWSPGIDPGTPMGFFRICTNAF